MSDRDGSNITKGFDEGFYSIDYDNIREISSFLREIAKDVEAEVIWLGPFWSIDTILRT